MILNNPFAKNDGTDPDWLERFVAKIDIRGEDECWNWTGARKGSCRTGEGSAYGSFLLPEKKAGTAHRIAYELKFGKPPASKPIIRHTCDNTLCCNFNHLLPGTNHDNMADKMSRGRGNHLVGDKHPNSKIKDANIPEILQLYWEKGATSLQIAQIYNVSRTTIERVINGSKKTSLEIVEPTKKTYHRRLFKQRIESLAPIVLEALQDQEVHSGRILSTKLGISVMQLSKALQRLREDGHNIQVKGGRGYRLIK